MSAQAGRILGAAAAQSGPRGTDGGGARPFGGGKHPWPPYLRRYGNAGVALAAGMALLAAGGAAAQSVDFEAAPYAPGESFYGADGWSRLGSDAVSADNYRVAEDPHDRFARIRTSTAGTVYREFPAHSGIVHLSWRWRAQDDFPHLCLGATRASAVAGFYPLALACIEPSGVLETKGRNAIAVAGLKWVKQRWYYMRLSLDAGRSTFSLHAATDSLRADETALVEEARMNDEAGTVSRVVFKSQNGTGLLDVDDITWEPVSLWAGNASDSAWSTAGNWIPAGAPGPHGRAVFDGNALRGCVLDKAHAVGSLSFARDFRRRFLWGGSLLSVARNAEFGGGQHPHLEGGGLAFISARGQALSAASAEDILPPVVHDGAGTLRLDGASPRVASLLQRRGRLDFNGRDLDVAAQWAVERGRPGTFANLGGRTVTVGGSARLEGSAEDTLLGLSPEAAWTLRTAGNGKAVARFAAIGKSQSLHASHAVRSRDDGGNSRWAFLAAPAFLSGPRDASALVGGALAFQVALADTSGVALQWYRDGAAVAGAAGSGLRIAAARLKDDGARFTCKAASPAGQVESPVAIARVDFPAPTASPSPQAILDTVTVTLASVVEGAAIMASLDGGPFEAAKGPLRLAAPATLQAYAALDGDVSPTASWAWPKAPRATVTGPILSPESRTFKGSLTVTMSPSLEGSSIRYTLDGSEPDSGKPAYAGPLTLTATTVVRAIAVKAGHHPSPPVTRIYTLEQAPDTQVTLGPGRERLLPGGLLLQNLGGGPAVKVEILRPEGLEGVQGFRDIALVARLTPEAGQAALLAMLPDGPALYRAEADGRARLITAGGAAAIDQAGTYFLGSDTLPPAISLLDETFLPHDFTRARLRIDDNTAEVRVDLERSDAAGSGWSGKAFVSGDTLSLNLRNSADSIGPLTLRVTAHDGRNLSGFPSVDGAVHHLSQKASLAKRTPRLFRAARDPERPWEMFSLPLAADPPITLDRLRAANPGTRLLAKAWDPESGYRSMADREAFAPGTSVWIGAQSGPAPALSLPSHATRPQSGFASRRVSLRKGWNLVSNPTLETLYWPITRAGTLRYDLHPVKTPHAWDPETGAYARTDVLEPWRGCFALNQGGDTVITLLRKPAPPLAAKRPAAPEAAGLELGIGRATLWLGATPQAEDGIGAEDEFQPPAPSEGGLQLFSRKPAGRLATDIVRWRPGQALAWNVVAALPEARAAATPQALRIASLSVPEGHAAWLVFRSRGMRVRAGEGVSLPLIAGFADTVDVLAGPEAVLESRLASIPTTGGGWNPRVAPVAGGVEIRFSLPSSHRVSWRILSLDGRLLDSGRRLLPPGHYRFQRALPGRPAPGIRIVDVEWSDSATRHGAGRLTRLLPIP